MCAKIQDSMSLLLWSMYLRSSRILLMAADTSGRSELELVRKEETVPEVTGTSSSIAWSWADENMLKHDNCGVTNTLASDEMRSDKSSSTSTDSNLTGLGMATLFKGDRCSGRRKLGKYFF